MGDMKVRLSTLWLFATLNYVYCDVVSVMDPVKHSPVQLTQGFLLGAAILVEIPIAMVLLSRILSYRSNRWTNVIAGAVMTAVQVASLFVAVPTMYYVFFSVIEVTCTALIVFYAWRWLDSASVHIDKVAPGTGVKAEHESQRSWNDKVRTT